MFDISSCKYTLRIVKDEVRIELENIFMAARIESVLNDNTAKISARYVVVFDD